MAVTEKSVVSGEVDGPQPQVNMTYRWQISTSGSSATAAITVVRAGQTVREYKKSFRDTLYGNANAKAKAWLDRELFILKT